VAAAVAVPNVAAAAVVVVVVVVNRAASAAVAPSAVAAGFPADPLHTRPRVIGGSPGLFFGRFPCSFAKRRSHIQSACTANPSLVLRLQITQLMDSQRLEY